MGFIAKHKKQIIVCVCMAAVYAAVLFPALFLGGNGGHTGGSLHNTLVFFSMFVFGVWGYYILFRAQEKRVRYIMTAIVALILFWLLTRTAKWLLPESGIGRHLWYCYYAAFIGLPLLWLFLFSELFIKKLSIKSKRRTYIVLGSAAVILLLLVMTNDLHEWVFSFPDIAQYNNYNYGAGLFAVMAFSILLLLSAFVLFIFGTVRRNGLRQFLAPAIIFAAILTYTVLYITPFYDVMAKVRPLNDTTFVLSLLAFLLIETSIRGGLIQNNGKYRRYFENALPPLRITGGNGATAYTGVGFIREIKDADDGFVYDTRKINGGTLTVQKDVSALRSLRRELSLKTAKLKRENKFLENRKALLAAEAALSHREALLAGIWLSVSEKHTEIERMVSALPDSIDGTNKNGAAEALALIKLMTGYMKQRCMLGLSAEAGGGTLTQNFELALGAMLKDAISVNIKTAFFTRGAATAEAALGFLNFAAEICGLFAFSGANFYITVNFGNGAVCHIITDKPAPKTEYSALKKIMCAHGITVTEEQSENGFTFSARITAKGDA